MILVFLMLSFKPTFSLPSFSFLRRFFSYPSLSAIRVVLSGYLKLLIFLLTILIPACFSSPPAFLMMYSAYKLNNQGDNIQLWHTPFPIWNQSFVPMSSSNCCFLTCIQVSQEAGKVVWYSHLIKNIPQFVVIHTVKGFSIVNEAEVDAFLEFPCFLYDQRMLAVWSIFPLPFLNAACTSGSSWFTYCWSLAWRILSIILLACESECNCTVI